MGKREFDAILDSPRAGGNQLLAVSGRSRPNEQGQGQSASSRLETAHIPDGAQVFSSFVEFLSN
jgi:hypothetical protein